MKNLVIIIPLVAGAHAGPYPGAAGSPGSDAVSKDDPAIVAWAAGHRDVSYGSDVDPEWRAPQNAVGKASGNSFDIVSLGNGGRITMYFPHPLRDGPGPDFAIFENSINDTFLELAFVEVSSNGHDWVRFPNRSLTPGPVGPFGEVDPTDIEGLAGKYRQGFGTPFDLADLPASPSLDRRHVVFVRVIDIIGDGSATDSDGRPVYDPTPVVGSAGFDLDGIAVLHQDEGPPRIVGFTPAANTMSITWLSNPGQTYGLERSTDLGSWEKIAEPEAEPQVGITVHQAIRPPGSAAFWRVRRLIPAPTPPAP